MKDKSQPSPQELQPLSRIARAMPPGRNGSLMAPSTLFRHITQGYGGLRLRAWVVSGRYMTTLAECMAYFEAIAQLRQAKGVGS